MSTTFSLLHDDPATLPALSITQRGSRLAQSVWRVLERAGQVRARRHLLDLAQQRDGIDPLLARRLRDAAATLGDA